MNSAALMVFGILVGAILIGLAAFAYRVSESINKGVRAIRALKEQLDRSADPEAIKAAAKSLETLVKYTPALLARTAELTSAVQMFYRVAVANSGGAAALPEEKEDRPQRFDRDEEEEIRNRILREIESTQGRPNISDTESVADLI